MGHQRMEVQDLIKDYTTPSGAKKLVDYISCDSLGELIMDYQKHDLESKARPNGFVCAATYRHFRTPCR